MRGDAAVDAMTSEQRCEALNALPTFKSARSQDLPEPTANLVELPAAVAAGDVPHSTRLFDGETEEDEKADDALEMMLMEYDRIADKKSLMVSSVIGLLVVM